ncbi:helix-turn-helix domain-containing protein [Chitinophaga oryziterrae]|uniref:Helix-turn-helix domain-containing protein n=1 Tax=Chitinophaga oryziterrae TaxID=1031224 RepID=A0A6N8JDI6_9BACT|nr:helix-turn-helix transcriptional regulator [Chitinophaga oryziterrae]MVT43280.1 helix-turn-helix domain-containing protein [Chitinophaga oryziterrae]
MARTTIPVYDICTIDKNGHERDLMIERFGGYLDKHYQALHHAHRHSFYHLVLFTKGSGTHTIDFVKFDVAPYQVYFMAPGQVHSWDFKGETDGYIIHFSADFFRPFLLNPSYLEQFSFFNGISSQCVRQLTPEIRPEIIRLSEALLTTVNKDLIRVRLLEMFMMVENNGNRHDHDNLPNHTSTLLKSFQQLINQYYRTMRLPKEYAELLYITPNHLNALCRELLGKTAGDVIRERVLLEAKRLLTNAGMNILEIAYELNFKDNSYFTRFFKNYEGITPEEFRKKFINQ